MLETNIERVRVWLLEVQLCKVIKIHFIPLGDVDEFVPELIGAAKGSRTSPPRPTGVPVLERSRTPMHVPHIP